MTPVEFYAARLDELEARERRRFRTLRWEEMTPDVRRAYGGIESTRYHHPADGGRGSIGAQWPGGRWMTPGEVAEWRAATEVSNADPYVLADIAAKRAVLRLAEAQFQPHAVMDGMGWEQYENGLTAAYRAVVAHLVQPFATHPDFDESWKL